MAMTSTVPAPRVSVGPAPPNGPVPKLTQRIIELLRVERQDLVVDLYCRDRESHQEIPEEVRPYDQMIALSPFSEQLAFRLITSGVRMVQMGTLTFGRFPMRYEQVVLRDGFSQFNDSLRRLLAHCAQATRAGGQGPHRRQRAQPGCAAICRRAAPLEPPASLP